MTLKAILTSGFVAGALTLMPLAAGAAPFTLSLTGPGYFGSNGSASATITETAIRPGGLGTLAGGFAVTGDLHGTGPENFTAWCLDIATYLNLPSKYITTDTPFQADLSGARLTGIERLFETGFKALTLSNNDDSAGFQLALWEVLYEDQAFDLTTGNFSAASSAGAIAKGQALLAGLAGPITTNYDLTYLQSTDGKVKDPHYSQNLVTASEVPLPAGGLLLAGALAGLAALRRRRAAQA